MCRLLFHSCLVLLLIAGFCFSGFSQDLRETDFNHIPDSYKSHPEYGNLRLPENPNAIELIHLRTQNSRTFADPLGAYYSVSTAGTFHFRDNSNRWVSIQDKISKSPEEEYGIYQTELPIQINYRSGKTEMALNQSGGSVIFGENSSLQYVAENGVVLKEYKSNKTMGEPGVFGNQLVLKDFLPGLNRVQETEYWSVRTDYFIEQQLNVPSSAQFLQISDELRLPSSWKITYGVGEMTPHGWSGDLLIVTEKGEVVSNISRPLYYDSFKSKNKDEMSSHLGVGTYQLTKTTSGYIIRLLVPTSWLNQENLVYPLVIDPTTTNTYATNFGLYELSGFNAACQVDMDLAFPPTGGYQVTGTNTSYRIWAKGFVYSSGGTDSYADKTEQRSRVGSLNGWSGTQSGTGTNHNGSGYTYTAANNGQTYTLNNLTIANGCYADKPTIPYQWQGYQTFFPHTTGPAAAQQTGCSMAYQELVTNTWVVTATYIVVPVVTPTAINYSSSNLCAALTSATVTQSGTTGGVYASSPAGLSINTGSGEVNPSASAAGTYTVTYSVGVAPCNHQSTAVLTILNSVTPTFNQVGPICSGGTFVLPSSSTNAPAITGTWSPAISNTATTTYTFTPDAGQCAEVATMTVVVDPVAAPTATSNSPVCSGGTINLSTAAVGTYSWTGPNGFASTAQNPTIPNATTAHSGTYSLTVASGACISSPATVNVLVNTTPVVTVTHTDVLCNGSATGSATATVTPPGTYSYSWVPSGGAASTANNLSAGNYTVTVANGSCSSTGSVTIAQPTAINLTTTATESVCGTPTGTASVSATGGMAPYTYSWSPSGGNGASASNLTAGAHTVTVTDANNCVQTATATVPSLNGPALSITNKEDVTCFGDADGTATVSATGGTAPYTYAWSPSGGTAVTAVDLDAGTYTVTATDILGCDVTIDVVISESPLMSLATSGTGASCGMANGTVEATASGGSGTYTYLWTPGNLSGATQANLSPGIYSVTATDGNGCSLSGSYEVVLIGVIPVSVTPISVTIDEGQSINLFASTTSTIPGITYSWEPPSGLSCVDCPNPIASPAETTTYTVTLTSPDGCAGKDSSQAFVRVICGEYFIPTIFSPNGDGNNDEFRIFGNCIVGMNLKIYDRWGELVFESTNPQDTWDGTYKGKMMNPAAFMYSVNLSFIDGRFIKEKGSINLVR